MGEALQAFLTNLRPLQENTDEARKALVLEQENVTLAQTGVDLARSGTIDPLLFPATR
jgi:hypothetical protein